MSTAERPESSQLCEGYAVQVQGTLRRRDAEALALELRELARRHGLTVARMSVRPSVPEEPTEQPS